MVLIFYSEKLKEIVLNVEGVCIGIKLKGIENLDFFDGWDNDEDDFILS